jgi:RDD family
MTAGQVTARSVTAQGHYAGAVSRFLAYGLDLVTTSAMFALALAAVSYVAKIFTGDQISWNRQDTVIVVLFVIWQFLYFGYSWAASGRTFGMAVLGVQVVRADGRALDHGAVHCVRWCSRSASCCSAWASSASWCSGSAAPGTISSPAPRWCTRGTPGQPGSGSSPARPN